MCRQSFRVVFPQKLEVLAIMMGEAQQVSDPQFSYCVARLPVINDKSLME